VASQVSGRDGDSLVVDAHGEKVRVPQDRAQVVDGQVWLGVRPEKVVLTPADEGGEGNSLGRGQIVDVSFVGVSTQYMVRTAWGQDLMGFEQNTGARPVMRLGDQVGIRFAAGHSFVLDQAQDARAGVEEDIPA
jgi:spermidine/putrescine transport system ATP-binding protein